MLLKAIGEACPFAIVALDQNGLVRMWSRGADEMFGLTEAESVGNPLPIPFEILEAQLHTNFQKGNRAYVAAAEWQLAAR